MIQRGPAVVESVVQPWDSGNRHCFCFRPMWDCAEPEVPEPGSFGRLRQAVVDCCRNLRSEAEEIPEGQAGALVELLVSLVALDFERMAWEKHQRTLPDHSCPDWEDLFSRPRAA
jgi:hypothetical protein